MLGLLKKDYFTNRYIYVIFMLAVSLIMIFISIFAPEGSIMIGVMGTIFIPTMVNKLSTTEEMRKNYDLVINSFPVKRSDVVISKYIYYLIIYIITAVILGTLIIVFNKLKGFDLQVLFIGESLLFLYYTFIVGLPNCIYYCFDYEVAAKYSVIITLGTVYIPMLLWGLFTKLNPNINVEEMISSGTAGISTLPMIIFLVGIIIYTVFIIMSIRGYKKKDIL